MKIQQLLGVEGAKKAEGLVVVIDIMRAATVEAYAFGQGAKYIIPVSTREEAFDIKKNNPEMLLIGETGGIKIEGFDYGNSPSEIVKADLKDKIIVHRTTSGTQGLVNAAKAEALIFGSFVTRSSITKYIELHKSNVISIVSMDPEDTIFAEFLEESIIGNNPDIRQAKDALRVNPHIGWFNDPSKPEFPKIDIEYALDVDRFDFLCLAIKAGEQLRVEPVPMS